MVGSLTEWFLLLLLLLIKISGLLLLSLSSLFRIDYGGSHADGLEANSVSGQKTYFCKGGDAVAVAAGLIVEHSLHCLN